MYGMVNKALQAMLVRRYGSSTWETAKAKAGITSEVFISNDAYPDEVTFRLVGSASETLGVPGDQLLHEFGEDWVLHFARESYGELMTAGGRNLPEFLEHLPNFHTRVALIFPHLSPPGFTCSDRADHSVRLHYYSNREGLAAFVVGLLHGLGQAFDTPVTVDHESVRATGCHHDVFKISWEGVT